MTSRALAPVTRRAFQGSKLGVAEPERVLPLPNPFYQHPHHENVFAMSLRYACTVLSHLYLFRVCFARPGIRRITPMDHLNDQPEPRPGRRLS